MKLYEVRAKSTRYATLGEIPHIMCTTLKKAKELANEWAEMDKWKCVWIIPFDVRDGVVCYSAAQMITIKDELQHV